MSKNNLVVKLKNNGMTLEVLAKPGTMKPYREGKMKMENVLIAEEIFSNSSKFQKAKNTEIKKCCDTDDKIVAIKKILDEGTFPLNKNELNEMTKNKRSEIVEYIHKYYHDSRPDPPIPHPHSRIEGVLNDMKVRIDPFQGRDQQIRAIVKKLPEFLPIKRMNPPHEMDFEAMSNTTNDKQNMKNRGRRANKRR